MKRIFLLTALLSLSASAVPTSAPPVDELALSSAREAPPFQLTALADSENGATPAPGVGQQLLDLLFSEKGLGLLAVIVGALGTIIGTTEIRRRRIALAVYHAFHVVEDVSKETETTADDKVAAGLKALDAYLLANGWRPAKPGEQEVAKLGFTALNGAAAAAVKAQTKAILEASKPSPQ